MAICDFCGNKIEQGTGKKVVKTDATVLDFCSRKCEKNMLKLGRKPRTTKWTSEYHKVKEGKKA